MIIPRLSDQFYYCFIYWSSAGAVFSHTQCLRHVAMCDSFHINVNIVP